jgi:hypothetical protein
MDGDLAGPSHRGGKSSLGYRRGDGCNLAVLFWYPTLIYMIILRDTRRLDSRKTPYFPSVWPSISS